MAKKNFFKLMFIGFAGISLGIFMPQWNDSLSQTKSEFPEHPDHGKMDPLTRKYVKGEYRAPRFPSYLKTPKTVDEVMPFARAAVRQVRGVQGGLGLVNSGETVLIVTEPRADEIMLQAVKKAYEERGIKVEYLTSYEAAGVSKEDAMELYNVTSWADNNHFGLAEVDRWFEKWWPKEAVKDWFKERRPDLFKAVYEKIEISEKLQKTKDKLSREKGTLMSGIIKYLDEHPEINAVLMGKGGSTSWRRGMGKYADKYRGLFIYDNQFTLMSRVPSFPGDLWQLIEERTIESIAWLDRVHAWDPEGTDVYWDMTQDDAENWAKGIYQQGHLYLAPRQATGRFPYSVVEYPAMTGKWLPPVMTRANGVIAGCSNHAGKFERTEVTVKNGYPSKITGLGKYAETWEYVRANYPRINDLTYPYYPEPGYFWHYETALGTNPKFVLAQGNHSGERLHAGIFHWAFGARLHHGPKEPFQPKEWMEFVKSNKLPEDHWMHIHNQFTTYKVRVRGTNKWLTLVDKGRLAALDDPMVRALASRYGDAGDLLEDEWIENLPGINTPGNYAQYARQPRESLMEVFDKVKKGTYEYYYTPPSMRKKK